MLSLGAWAVIGVAGGLLAGAFGSGGQALVVALLTLLGVPQHLAQGAALTATVPPVGLPAVLAYRKSFGVDVGRAAWLAAGFGLGASLGAYAAQHVPVRPLAMVFGAVFAFMGVRTLAVAWVSGLGPATPTGRAPAHAAWIGLVAGACSGLLGISGGVVAIPLLRRVFGLPHERMQATSMAAMLLPLGLPAALVYARATPAFPWVHVGVLCVSMVAGITVGGRLAVRLRGGKLQVGFALLQVALGLSVALRAALTL